MSLLDDIMEIFKVFDRSETGFVTSTDLKIFLGDLVDENILEEFC